MKKFLLLLSLAFIIAGCSATNEAIKSYENCKDDPECYHQMLEAKQSSYLATKTGLNLTGMPSVTEVFALLVSNIAAFGVGVLKGKRKS